ncbi:RNA-guided endonuclease InsQ/TnpB family protein, partial [Natrialbaceae archaeon A-CW1-1]
KARRGSRKPRGLTAGRVHATEYDAVFVENLDVKSMLESEGNARNKSEVGWSDFRSILEHHCDKHGTHYVEVTAHGTTKECACCGVETAKPLWVREHSCPSCGFELDRDWNAALNVKSRGLEKLGVVHSKGTPVKTATAVDVRSVSASRVVETGSSCLKEAV